jgi:hypothetical protein
MIMKTRSVPLSVRFNQLISFAAGAVLLALALHAHAQDSICARVKIEIKQELTFERQAFDAEMQIVNGLDTNALENVGVTVTFADDAGTPVRATSDPNDTTALFFIRVNSMSGINNVGGTGTVAPATTADVHWLIIPAPGAGGTTPLGKLYLVGASLRYTLGGEQKTVAVTPDSIYVRPLPKLALDYFLTSDVYGDDPFTAAIEPPVPFTLGVRIKNSGYAPAKSVKIESAQPKIVDNKQGLLVNFLILGSFVNDQPATNSLLIDFGQIDPSKASTGRWNMIATLSGRFVDFTASYTHSDELGGAVTSLIDKLTTHALIKDVRVDLPGRDNVRDFLAKDGDAVRVYESDTIDTLVTDQSAAARLTGGTAATSNVTLALSAPPTAGFFYVKLSDPYQGTKVVGPVVRSDGKIMAADNVWLSKSRTGSGPWQYFISFFDANTTGRYNVVMKEPDNGPKPPAMQFIPDRTVKEGSQISFLVEASDPNGDKVILSAAPLPSGAKFTDGGAGQAIFDWTPVVGQAGKYSVTYQASDGTLSTSQSAAIVVTPAKPTGPDIPTLVAPALASDVRVLRPILTIQSTNPLDTALKYYFEVYADAGLSTLIAQGEVAKGTDATTWKLPLELTDNANYFWRVRAFDGTLYSEWLNARFRVNLSNEPPAPPVPSAPRDGLQVDTLTPTLAVQASTDPDGDPVTFGFQLYSDSAAAHLIASISGVPAGSDGSVAWQIPQALQASKDYWWRASASDPHGALTETALLRFTVNPANHAPAAPVLVQPEANATVPGPGPGVTLTVANATDPDGDATTYFFELDTLTTFNGNAKRGSGAIPGGTSTTSWSIAKLSNDTRYYWRARATDGKADGPWVTGQFLVSSADTPPPVPVLRNLGDASWTDSAQPRLEIAPVLDPQGQVVTYAFQVYADLQLQNLVTEAQTVNAEWLVPTALADGNAYYWRVRAVDSSGNTSAWSAAAGFKVILAGVPAPSLTFSAPNQIVEPSQGKLKLAWEVRDALNSTTLALYWDRDNSGADGTLIVDNLVQDPGKRAGEYVWNTASLEPGSYYVYALAGNGQRSITQYAPGVVMVPSPTPKGSVIVKATSAQTTTEAGGTATFQVSLGSEPAADVTLSFNSSRPGEARVNPASVTFTQGNWNQPQTLTVKGLNDCVPDGDQPYRIIASRAESSDTNYDGVKGADLAFVNRDDDTAVNSPLLPICNLVLVSSTRVGLLEFEYSFLVDLTNLGPDLQGVNATVTSTAAGTTILDGKVIFGPVPSGGTVTSQDTFTIRQDRRIIFDPSTLHWNPQPVQ